MFMFFFFPSSPVSNARLQLTQTSGRRMAMTMSLNTTLLSFILTERYVWHQAVIVYIFYFNISKLAFLRIRRLWRSLHCLNVWHFSESKNKQKYFSRSLYENQKSLKIPAQFLKNGGAISISYFTVKDWFLFLRTLVFFFFNSCLYMHIKV